MDRVPAISETEADENGEDEGLFGSESTPPLSEDGSATDTPKSVIFTRIEGAPGRCCSSPATNRF